MDEIPFRRSPFLEETWTEINSKAFDGELEPPAAIGWVDYSEFPEADGIKGGYAPSSREIGISAEWESAEEDHARLENIATDPGLTRAEKAALVDANFTMNIDRATSILAHEMAHQASHQQGFSPSSHGANFARNAQRIADALEFPSVVPGMAETWPFC